MNLAKALRIHKDVFKAPNVCFVGAGGKTTSLFQLAKDLVNASYSSVIVTATTHLSEWQTSFGDHHIIATKRGHLNNLPSRGVILITGEIENGRAQPITDELLYWLREFSFKSIIPLLIEADGSRQKSLKAPAIHEPPVPEFADTVVVVAGLQTISKPLNDENVHRAQIFSQLSNLQINEPISPNSLIQMLIHPQGGLKNIPPQARRVVLLNRADSTELQSIGGNMATRLLDHYDSVLVGEVQRNNLQVFEHCAGIILAAGKSSRYGSPKQLLEWKGKPFVRHIAETALQAGLWPVAVVTGAHAADVGAALNNLPVKIVHNPDYPQGQSTSICAGLESLPQNIGAGIFLLADQPQIPVEIIRALTEAHTQNLQLILAPLVLGEKRANPVLFDRSAFPDLLNLTGDVGGRAIFDKHHVEYIPWHNDALLFDVDRPEDYQRLKEME